MILFPICQSFAGRLLGNVFYLHSTAKLAPGGVVLLGTIKAGSMLGPACLAPVQSRPALRPEKVDNGLQAARTHSALV